MGIGQDLKVFKAAWTIYAMIKEGNMNLQGYRTIITAIDRGEEMKKIFRFILLFLMLHTQAWAATVTCYVNADSGSDSNSCTEASPCATVSRAFTQPGDEAGTNCNVATNDCTINVFTDGTQDTWVRETSLIQLNVTYTTGSLIVQKDPASTGSGKPVVTIFEDLTAATWDNTGITAPGYHTTCTAASDTMIVFESDGTYTQLSEVASTAAVTATSGTYYKSGTDCYAHLSGDVDPTGEHIETAKTTYTFNLTGDNTTLDGLAIYGGSSAVVAIAGDGTSVSDSNTIQNCLIAFGKLRGIWLRNNTNPATNNKIINNEIMYVGEPAPASTSSIRGVQQDSLCTPTLGKHNYIHDVEMSGSNYGFGWTFSDNNTGDTVGTHLISNKFDRFGMVSATGPYIGIYGTTTVVGTTMENVQIIDNECDMAGTSGEQNVCYRLNHTNGTCDNINYFNNTAENLSGGSSVGFQIFANQNDTTPGTEITNLRMISNKIKNFASHGIEINGGVDAGGRREIDATAPIVAGNFASGNEAEYAFVIKDYDGVKFWGNTAHGITDSIHGKAFLFKGSQDFFEYGNTCFDVRIGFQLQQSDLGEDISGATFEGNTLIDVSGYGFVVNTDQATGYSETGSVFYNITGNYGQWVGANKATLAAWADADGDGDETTTVISPVDGDLIPNSFKAWISKDSVSVSGINIGDPANTGDFIPVMEGKIK